MAIHRTGLYLPVLFAFAGSISQAAVPPAKITTPKQALGFNLGDDFHMASYSQLETYWKKLASESDRMKLVDIGLTAEGRHQYMAILSSPENLKNLEHYRDIARRLSLAEGLSDQEAHQLGSRKGKPSFISKAVSMPGKPSARSR